MKEFNNKGFTLIELMVVVAIIGVLAAIGIPNYQKFLAKSLQTEAKIALSSIYSAEASTQMEQNGYTACLANIGYASPVSVANVYYGVGFTAASTGSVACTINGAATSCLFYAPGSNCAAGAGVTFFPAGVCKGNGCDFTNVVGEMTGDAMGAATFTATATADISSTVNAVAGASANRDNWTIDETKTLRNPVNVL